MNESTKEMLADEQIKQFVELNDKDFIKKGYELKMIMFNSSDDTWRIWNKWQDALILRVKLLKETEQTNIDPDKILDFAFFVEKITDKFKKLPSEFSEANFKENFSIFCLSVIRKIEKITDQDFVQALPDSAKYDRPLNRREFLDLIFSFSFQYLKDVLEDYREKIKTESFKNEA